MKTKTREEFKEDLVKHFLSCIASLREALDSKRFDPHTWPSGPLYLYVPNPYNDFRENDLDGCELWLENNISPARAADFRTRLGRCLSDWGEWIQKVKQSNFPTKHTFETMGEWRSRNEVLKQEWDELMETFEETREYLLKLHVHIESTILDPQRQRIKVQKRDGQGSGDNISGISWQEAKEIAGKYVDKHGFENVTKLAEQVGCNIKTMRKAIKNSKKLQEAKHQSKKKTSPPTKGLNEEIIDNKESPPEEQADVNLLIKKYSRVEMIEGIIESTRIIDKAELKKNPEYKTQDEKTIRLELGQQDIESLAQIYLIRKAEIEEIHADDPKTPGHRRKA